MSKKLILTILIIVLGLGAGYYYWKNYASKTPEQKAVESLEKVFEAISESSSLPDVSPVDESIGKNITDVNPVNKINPFKDAYKNPFE